MVAALVLLNTASSESCTVPGTWWALGQRLFDPCPGSLRCFIRSLFGPFILQLKTTSPTKSSWCTRPIPLPGHPTAPG